MKTKILYEIRKYEQEVYVNEFQWIKIKPGCIKNGDVFKKSDIFKSSEYEIIEKFENEQDARKEFKDYQSGVSSEIQMSVLNVRFVFEFYLAEVKYYYDDNGNVVKSKDIKNEMADFSNYVIFKRDIEEELEHRLYAYADNFEEIVEELESLDCEMCNKEEAKKGIESLRMFDTYKFDCNYKNDCKFSVEFDKALGFEDFIIHTD